MSIRCQDLWDSLASFTRSSLPVVRQTITERRKSLLWEDFVEQTRTRLMELPAFTALMQVLRQNQQLGDSFLCYPATAPQYRRLFPPEDIENLFFISYAAPLLLRYILTSRARDYFLEWSQKRFLVLYHDLENYAYSPRINLRFIVPLIANFKFKVPCRVGKGLSIRTFRGEERKNWDRWIYNELIEIESRLLGESALEWYTSCAKAQVYDFLATNAPNTISRGIACLRVLGAEVWAPGVGYSEWPPVFAVQYPEKVVFSPELTMPLDVIDIKWPPESFSFSTEKKREYIKMWIAVESLPEESRLAMALHYLNRSFARTTTADLLLDSWSGLDALAGQQGQELGYAISTRLAFLIARFLGQGSHVARDTIRDMMNSYKMRGAIVHPRHRSKKQSAELKETAFKTREWLRNGIRGAIAYEFTGDIPIQIEEELFRLALPQ